MANGSLPRGTVVFGGQGQAGNWSDPANWTGGALPGLTSGIGLFQSDATLNGSFSAFNLMLLGNEHVTVNGTLNTLSTNLCRSLMVCDNAVMTFSPGATLNDAGGLVVGNDAVGTLVVQGNVAQHVTMNTRDLKVGQHQNSVGTVTVTDSVWHNTDRMFVGLTGPGTMTLNGSQMSVGACFGIGVNKGGVGSVTLNASTLSVGTFAVIGGNGLDSDTPAPSGTGIGTGTLTVDAGSTFSVAQFLKISAGSAAVLAGGSISVANSHPGLTVDAGATLSGYGTVSSGPARHACSGIIDSGVVKASGGTLVLNAPISGTGLLQIGDGSTLAITGLSVGVPTIAFTGSNGTLSLAHGIAEHATITGFAAGDSIVMAGVDGMSFSASTDMLSLTSGSHVVDTLHLAGSYSSTAFSLTQTTAGAVIGFASVHTASVLGH